ncbi:MAG: TerC family protein [Armatimonadetes bacterium]|nr:TerC family protein [Armatimonadota bacterium]
MLEDSPTLLDPQHFATLATLTLLEIVLGIDNIVFLAILVGRLDPRDQPRARQLGLFLAMFMRIGLLMGISWLMTLTRTLFTIGETDVNGKDLILIAGGLFLIGKATHEIHHKLEGPYEEGTAIGRSAGSFAGVIVQIVLIDMVFSLDSVITAVGMANQLWIMIAAVVLAVATMMVFAGPVSDFVNRHPSVKMLALSFLILIGVVLIAEGTHRHIDRGYIYFAMAFSLGVEFLNLRTSARPVALKEPHLDSR